MAFGGLKGTLSVALNSITNPTDATGSVAVAIGDLVYVVVGEQTAPTSTAVTDNLGNSYAALQTATDAGTSTGHAFYSRVTVADTLTTIHVAATGSAQNVSVVAAVIEGPFALSPLDANPTQITTDTTSPFTCPATGTMAQAFEVVIAWGVATGSTVWAATSPNLLALNLATQSILKVAVGHQAVVVNTTIAPAFTAAADPTDCVLGTSSFARAPETHGWEYFSEVKPVQQPTLKRAIQAAQEYSTKVDPTSYCGFQDDAFQNSFNATYKGFQTCLTYPQWGVSELYNLTRSHQARSRNANEITLPSRGPTVLGILGWDHTGDLPRARAIGRLAEPNLPIAPKPSVTTLAIGPQDQFSRLSVKGILANQAPTFVSAPAQQTFGWFVDSSLMTLKRRPRGDDAIFIGLGRTTPGPMAGLFDSLVAKRARIVPLDNIPTKMGAIPTHVAPLFGWFSYLPYTKTVSRVWFVQQDYVIRLKPMDYCAFQPGDAYQNSNQPHWQGYQTCDFVIYQDIRHRRPVRDYWDRDPWGRFLPGSGYH